MRRPSKCCYPDCFHCPYDDCMTDMVTEEETLTDKQLGITWYSKNRDKVLEKARKKRLENPEAMRQRDREYRANMTEMQKQHIRDKQRERYWRNPDKYREQKKEYYRKKREQSLKESV